MKIVFLVQSFLPKWVAGTEIATYNIASNLVTRKHEVHVLTTYDRGLSQISAERGFTIHRVSFPRIKLLGIAIFWLKLFLIIRETKVDIVHVQGIGMGIPAYLSKIFLRIPYVVWGQGSDVYLPWQLKRSISKIVLSHADEVIALTEKMRLEILKNCKRQIKIIPNGIDLGKFHGLSKKEARRELKILFDEKIIIFVGTLRPVKDVKCLVQAIKILRNKEIFVKLILIGDGPDREELEKTSEELGLKDVISFVGKVPNDRIPHLMVASDVFAMSSLSEGFPIVILEAMASGLPVIATNVGGLPDLIQDGENGFLVEPRKPEKLAEKIFTLLENEDLRKKMSENNKNKVRDYNWPNIIDSLAKDYFEIIGRFGNLR